MSLVGGMVAGADSIDDMGWLRHGGLPRLFAGVQAPSTLGSFLRSFTHGHVKQLHAMARRLLPRLASRPPLLPGANQVAYVDIDDTIRRTYGYAKQGAEYGYSKVKGLNALLGIVPTPLAAPVIAATRPRKGPSNSARGAAAFVAETICTARAAGACGLLVVRADSAFYGADVINAWQALKARFSVTVRMNAFAKAAIAAIDKAAWTAIRYPKAVWDEEGQCWISDAKMTEIGYTVFTSKPKKHQVTARLIVRRVKRQGSPALSAGQGTLFDTWRRCELFEVPRSFREDRVPRRSRLFERRAKPQPVSHWLGAICRIAGSVGTVSGDQSHIGA
ncbi:transposase [Streptomyces sp. NPDC058228]|uniref:transposase n=2 Tax=unclassified Streptomyces TaxID=2593676 RepID=UPI0036E3E76A